MITGLIVFTMLFGGGMIPTYILVNELGLTESRWSLIIPSLVSAWNMIILRNFFQAIPSSMKEAAYIDGAGEFTVLLNVVIPLSKASIATITMFYAVGRWNAWFDAFLYISNPRLLPMQNILRNILSSVSALDDVDTQIFLELDKMPPSSAIQAATIVLTTIPILVVYPLIQKHYEKGIMISSLTG